MAATRTGLLVLTLCAALMGLVCAAAPARAETGADMLLQPPAMDRFEPDELRALQLALSFSEDYPGQVDGRWGPASARALARFSRREFADTPRNGHLAALAMALGERIAADGWVFRYQPDYGLSVLFPAATASLEGHRDGLVIWQHGRSSLRYEFRRDTAETVAALHGEIAGLAGPGVTPRLLRRTGLHITRVTRADGTQIHARSDRSLPAGWGTVLLTAAAPDRALLGAVAASISREPARALTPPGDGMLGQLVARMESLEQAAPPDPAAGGRNTDDTVSALASGTGFIVNDRGLVLTNQHVVEDCSRITVEGRGARIRSVSEAYDLALLEVPELAGRNGARFSRWPVELNADILAAGFPYSDLLDGINVTRGSVSSLKGSRGSDFDMQITAPVQPGNSGGPVLDSLGNVVGVVVARLDKEVVRAETGSIPENINFAVRGEIALRFLNRNGVAVRIGSEAKPMSSIALGKLALDITVYIECS